MFTQHKYKLDAIAGSHIFWGRFTFDFFAPLARPPHRRFLIALCAVIIAGRWLLKYLLRLNVSSILSKDAVYVMKIYFMRLDFLRMRYDAWSPIIYWHIKILKLS